MKSPFAIFRKHQKMMMVVLVGLAMFAFIVMDSLQMTDRGGNSGGALMLIAALIGGVLFWALGRPTGNGATYGVVGAAIGLALALFVPGMFAPPPPYQTLMGDLDQKKLQQLADRRAHANNFLQHAFEKVMPLQNNNPILTQFYMQRLQGMLFGFGQQGAEDLVIGYLLSQEADEMGITLSDEAVSKYITQATDNKLAKEDFREIRNTLRLSETDLYNALREELRIRLAFIHTVPREVVTPEQYWEEYEKLTVRKELDVAALPVKDFLGEIPEPTESEVEQFFNTHRTIFPDSPQAMATDAAFGQPRRIRIGFLQSAYNEQLESEVATVTDADVEKYYNDNKEQFRNRRVLDDPLTPAGAATPQGPLLTPELPARPDSGATPPAEPKPEAPKSEAPKSEAETKPEPEQKAEPEKKTEPEKKADPGQASTNISEGLVAAGPSSPTIAGDVILAALQEEKKAEEKKEEAPKEEAPKVEVKAEPKKEEAPAKADAPKTEAAEEKPAAPDAKPAAPATPDARKPVDAEKPVPEFRPLDNTLKEEIREQLLRERARAEQKTRIDGAIQFMYQLLDRYSASFADLGETKSVEERVAAYTKRVNEKLPEIKQELEKYAAEHKLKYVETRPVSGQELFEGEEEFPIGRATEPTANEFSRTEPMTVLANLFRAPADQLLAPALAADANSNWYGYWKIEDTPQHVPKLDDPGVREQVITAWKKNAARPKVDERGKQLAEMLRKGTGATTELLKGQTVTGKPDSPAVTVVPTTPVSWLRVSTVPSTGMMPNRQPQLSDIPGVEDPDNNFMKTIFDQMKVGDVNVLPNADRSIYYVVKVKGRTPSEPGDIEAHRQAFLREDFFSGGGLFGGATTYDYLLSRAAGEARDAWFRQLKVKYALKENLQPVDASGKGGPSSPLGS